MEEINSLLKQIWPDWEIVEEIGHGTFATVYKAVREDIVGTAYAAVKVIRISGDSSDIDRLRAEGEETSEYYQNVVKEFAKEITLMYSVKGHNNIVAIEDYKVFQSQGDKAWYIFIRMELLTPLVKKLALDGITEREIIRIGIDLCTALDVCGSYKIVHRDIKPENIFVNDRGDYKLGDFGVARTLERMTYGMTRTGTLNYMAPEVVKSALQEMDYLSASRVDIYSLGIVLYWLGNGIKLPFLPRNKQVLTPDERNDAFRRRINGESLPMPVSVSPGLGRIILKACSYRPEDRYSTAKEMRLELQALLAADEDQEGDGSRKEQGQAKPVQEGGGADGPGPDDEPKDGQAGNRKGRKWIVALICAVLLAAAGFFLFGTNKDGKDSGDPTGTPAVEPTKTPTEKPTKTPTEEPTKTPTEEPTKTPTKKPTKTPTEEPTKTPTEKPTKTPTEEPTGTPTEAPTGTPTEEPTGTPTEEPTGTPMEKPTGTPTEKPTGTPTEEPTGTPTEEPTGTPTEEPTGTPTEEPTQTPVPDPTATPLPTEPPRIQGETALGGEVEIIAGDNKAIRKMPDPKSELVKMAEPGSRYLCYGRKKGSTGKFWYHIWIPELDTWGWVSSILATKIR